jgi:putative transposase
MKAYQLHVHADHFAAPETLDLFVAYAVWAYHWFSLSTADTEDLLAERGVIVHGRITSGIWTKSLSRFGVKNPSYGVRSTRMETSSKFEYKQVGTPKLESASSQD